MTDRINPDIPSLVKSLRTAASVSDIVNNSVARDFMKAINATTAWQSTAGLSLLRNSELLKNLQAPGIALGKLADHSRVFDDLAKSMAAYRERFVTPLQEQIAEAARTLPDLPSIHKLRPVTQRIAGTGE